MLRSAFGKLSLVTLLLFFASFSSFAQSGPGGVDFSAALWLRADSAVFSDAGTTPAVDTDPVVQWNDLSSFGNNASVGGANPTFQIGGQNGRPYLSFSDDDMDFALNEFAIGSDARSVFMVAEYPVAPGTQQYFFSYGPNVVSQRYSLGVDPSNALIVEMQGDGITSDNTVSAASPFIFSTIYPFGDGALNTSQIFINGANSTHTGGTATPATVLTSGSVGALPNNTLQFNGDIYEVIYYNDELNDAARTIVENYLSAKYDIPISNDLYAGDLIPSGDFDFDVIGIGRDAGASHIESASGGLKLADDSFLLDDGDYVFAGHSGTSNGFSSNDLPANHNMRLARDWYIDIADATSNGGTINLEFDLAEMGLSVPTNAFSFVLITRPGTSGAYTEVMMDTGISGDIVEFYGVDVTTLVDGHKYTVAFATENGLDFDGAGDYVELFEDDLFTGNFTVEAWVYLDDFSADYRPIISKSNSVNSNAEFNLQVQQSTGNVNFFLGNGSGISQVSGNNATDQDITLNTWTHIAAVVQGTDLFLYINGQLSGSSTFSGIRQNNANPVQIGRYFNGATQFWDGQIDEVRIWNTARTQEQINANAFNTIISQGTLEASYDFNQGVPDGNNTGLDNLPDLTPNLNHGMLNGFALSGSSSNWVTSTAMDNDVFAPIFLMGYPLIDNISTTGFDITVQLNEPGTYYYVVVTDGSPVPTIGQVTSASATGQVASGNIAVTTPATDFVLSPTGLIPNTFYDVYLVAQDDEGSPNVQIANTAFDVTTEAGFITRWVTSDGQITIPTTGGGYNYSVEWNNITNPGTNEGFIDNRTGDYTITGLENTSTYEVIIRGSFPRIYFNNTGDKDKIQSIEQWGNISWTFFQSAFYGCTNLTYNATDAPDLSGVAGLGSMFRNASSFNATDLTSWDVSGINDMGLMFSGATAFNGDVSNWNVSNVITMTEVFRDLPSFDQDLSGWTTTSATNMSGMFQGSSAFDSDLSGWDLNGVTNTSFMFFNASSFNQDLSLWDVTTITNMTNMLSNTAISVANYDAILNGWASQSASLQVGVTLGATGLGYSSTGEAGRTTLTTAPSSWTISGDQLVTPAAPTEVVAYASSVTDITLEWTDNATNETGYLIERADDYAFTVNVQTINTIGADATSYVFSAGTDQGYFFRVTSINGFEDASSQSNIEFATTEAFPGHALSFDGTDDSVVVPHDPQLNLVSGDFAIESWVYLNASGTQTIASKGDGNGIATDDAWILQIQGDKIALQLVDGVSTSEWGLGTTNVPLNEWVHVAVSFTGTTASFYLNGVADGTHNYGFSPSDNGDSQSMYMARQGSVCDCNYLNGDLDELKIWSAVKSDFSDRYSPVDLSIPQPNLVAYYSFDEGVGATNTVDASANINDGSISGATSIPSTVVQDGVVSNTNNAGPGSLRAAIDYANANPSTTITFDIAGNGPWNIDLQSALPQITANNTIIDGTSQSGWTFGDASAMVTIDGSSVPVNNHGIDINASGVEIYGMIVTGFTGITTYAAINLESDAADNVVIGANATGNILHGNGVNGIYIDGADGATIQGNWIGTIDGSSRSENTQDAISITGTCDNLTIGGNFGSGLGNVISGAGNGSYGIVAVGGGSNLIIRGNYIGTDATGNAQIYNEGGGINIGGTYTFSIGGVSAGEENVISGNNTDINADGIVIGSAPTGSIINNIIGLGTNGTTPLGNGGNGIALLSGSHDVLVNGNTISSNGAAGLAIGGGTVNNHTVTNNIIGLTQDGLTPRGNATHGINVSGTGGTDITITGNTIGANLENGINISMDQTNLDISGNHIGVDINGNGNMILDVDEVTVLSDNTIGNQASGIYLNVIDGASTNNSIINNTISGNGIVAESAFAGTGSGITINLGVNNVTIQGNRIGVESDGVTKLKNINSAIYINSPAGHNGLIIGGEGGGEENTIGYSGDYGIQIVGTETNNNQIYANDFICNEKGGISYNSTPDIDAPVITSISGTTISGTSTAEDNSNIFIYEADSCAFDQGKLIASAIDAVSGGSWTIGSGSFDPTKQYLAVVVDDEIAGIRSTSEFSAPASIPPSVVINTDDSGSGSLREAINYANANPGTTITFDISSGPYVINLASALPQITANNTIIDGTTLPVWSFGSAATMVTINGLGIGGNANGINIDAANVEVYGLILTGFSGDSSNGNIYLASDAADFAIIGGSGAGNIIHGSDGNAIYIVHGDSAVIRGNRIGTLNGSTLSAIGDHGIATTGEIDDLIIGGDFFAGEGNLISGAPAFRYGLNLFGSGGGTGLSNVEIKGNKIGTNDSANGAIANTLGGINILGTINGVEIGGPSPSDLNIISGNGDHGIIIQAGNTFDIDGNYIGLQSDGSTALGNAGAGIRINSAAINVNIGANSQNLISENGQEGIFFNGNSSSNTALGTNIFSCNANGGIGYNSGPLTPGGTIDAVNLTTAVVSTAAADGSSVYVYFADDGCSNDQGIAFAGSGVVASGQAVVSGGFAPNAHYVALVEDLNGFSTFSSPYFANFVMVINTNDTGTGSFRAAIDSANMYPGASIFFNIAGGGPWPISLASELPEITGNGTIIDGTSQPGWNMDAGDMVTLDGTSLALASEHGLTINAANVEIYGLLITNFPGSGIISTPVSSTAAIIGDVGKGNVINNNNLWGVGLGWTNSFIVGNRIGTNSAGTAAAPNGSGGVALPNNTTVTDNLISGHNGPNDNGIFSNTTGGHLIANNLIGTDITGTFAIPNDRGIAIVTGGGLKIIDNNLISGNTEAGIWSNGGFSDNDIINNIIGMDSTLSSAIPNGTGILYASGSGNRIGYRDNPNIIAGNTGAAIETTNAASVNNSWATNEIYGNGSGIVFAAGANNGILPPSIDNITSTDASGSGNDGDMIHLYYSDAFGQGQTFLDSVLVSGGTWNISGLSLSGGDELVVTATNATDGTSEFSLSSTFIFNYPTAEGAGEALYFDGTDDYVDISSFDVAGWNEIMVEAWIKPDVIPGGPGNNYATIVGKGSYGAAGNTSFALYLFGSDGPQELRGRIDNGSTVEEVTFNSYNLSPGEWVHVAMSWTSGNAVELYVNGILEDSSSPLSGTINSVGDNIIIGSSSNGSELLFEGEIDEVKIWNKRLQENGIRQYLAKKVTDTHPDFSNLVAYYRMDDSGDALNLTDYKGANNGTIEGGMSYVLSGAHVGDDSFYDYLYAVGEGRSLDYFRVSNLGTANLPLHIYRISGTPANNVVSGFDNIADTAYYGVFAPDQTYDISDSVGNITTARRILYREDGSDPIWTSISGPLGIDFDDDQVYAYGQNDNGQFATAIDQNPYPTPVDAGYAMSFDGGANDITTSSMIILPFGDFTVEAWVKKDLGSIGIRQFLSQEGTTPFYMGLLTSQNIRVGDDWQDTGVPYPDDGGWHHIVAVKTSTNTHLYVDGDLKASLGSAITNPDGGNFTIGRTYLTSEYWMGEIDEVRVWDVALSETNIRDHMIGKIDPDFDSLNHLVAYYRFDENSTTDAANLAGDTDGTVTGATPVISGAPQGQGSIYSYEAAPGILNTAQFGEDANIHYQDASAGIHGYVVQGNPNQLQADGFDDLDQGKYYGVFAPGQTVDIRMDYNGANDPQRRIVYRKDPSDNAASGGWERLSGLINTSNTLDSVFAYNVPTGEVSTAVLNPPSSYLTLGDTDPGSALNFTAGDEEVLVDNDFNFVQNSGVFTIEFWMRADDLTNDSGIMSTASATADNGFMIALNNAGAGSIRFASFRGAGGQYVYDGNTGAGFISDNNWHHIAIVSDGSSATLYLDGDAGTDLGGSYGTLATGAATNTLALGGYSAFAGSSFNGDLDEVRIWNAAISQTDISSFANTTDISSHPNYGDMLAYYKFDDGTGSTILEDVFANNDGTLTNMDENTDWVGSGALANAPEQNALNFDGTDDFVSIARTQLSSGMTYEAWVNTTSTDAASVYEGNAALTIIGDTHNDVGLSFGITNGRVEFHHFSGSWVSVQGNVSVNDGAWHHVAVTHHSDGTVSLYIDGILDNIGNITYDPSYHHFNRVGSSYNAGTVDGDFFIGEIDEVRIWDIVLSESEIRDNIYAADLSGHTNYSNLLVHYGFNQGSDAADNSGLTTLNDISSYGNIGTLNNFTLNGPTSNWVASGIFNHTPVASSTQASNLIPFGVTENSVNVTWTNGNGQRRIVAVFEGIETEMPIPSDNQFFNADPMYMGDGDIVDGSWYAAYNGYGNAVTITGLTPGADYTIAVLEVNGPPTYEAYNSNADTDNPVNFSTNAAPEPFITTWEANGGQVTIPSNLGGGDYNIDWYNLTNPGTQEGSLTNQNGSTTVTGMEDGSIYQVEISGDFPDIRFAGEGDYQKILSIEQWGDIQWQTFDQAFYECSNLTNNATDVPDLSNVTSLNQMFYYAPMIDGDFGGWDVSTITDMSGMFDGTAISVTNYDNTLIGWSGQTLQSVVTLGADGLTYSSSAQSARDILINSPNLWLIEGDAQAIVQNALNFDGVNDYVNLPTTLITGTGSFTIEGWINTTTTTGGVIMTNRDGNFTNIYWLSTTGAGNLQFYPGSLAGPHIVSTSKVNDGQWHHFAAVRKADGTYEIYVDGKLEASSSTGVTNVVAQTTVFGYNPRDNSSYLAGTLDEIRIWNTDRSEAEITSNLSNIITSDPNLVAYYDFNEGVAEGTNTGLTSLGDITGNGNDGTLTNFVLSGTTSNWVGSLAPDAGIISIVSPNGGESTNEGDSYSITWNDNFDSGDVLEIYWSSDGGSTSNFITDGTAGTFAGSYSWTVPNSIGSDNLIIVNNQTLAVSDTSDAVFTINEAIDNYALEFEPSAQYVSIPDNPVFDMDGDWTIEAWIKTPSTGQQSIITQISGNTGYSLFKIGGTLYFQYYNSGGFQNGATSLSAAAGIDDDQWHHIAVSQNVNNGKIYVDGVPVFTSNSMIGIDEPSTPIRLGYDAFVGNLTGVLDEVRFWDYQRSDSEVFDHYDSELNGDESGLVAYYPFGDGTGSTNLTDATGNGNDGTLNSMDENTDWVAGPTLNLPSGEPLTPTDFIATEELDGSVTLSWTDNAIDETDYIIEQSSDNAAWSQFGGSLGIDAVTTNTGVITAETANWWRVVAVGSGGNATSPARYAGNITPPGNALEFDGIDDHVSVGDVHDFASPFTIEAWVSRATTGNPDWVVSNGTSPVNTSEYLHFGFGAGNQLRLDFYGDGVSSTETITDADWHHIAATYDGTEVALYLDGEALTIADPSIAPFAGIGDFRIGQAFDSEFFQGQIDEVRVWSRDLSQAEIQTNLYNTLIGNEANLMAYYRFDHSAEFELADYSDSNISGFLQGMDPSDWVPSGAMMQIIPDATFTTIPVTGGNVDQGSTDNLIYKFSIAAAGGDITKEGMTVAVGGDATTADFSASGWKLYESANTDTGIGGASLVGSTNMGDVAVDTVGFVMSGDILDGDTHYFYIAVDIDGAATAGNSFNVVLWIGDPTESVGIADPKNKVDGGFIDGNTFTIQSGDVTPPTPVISSSESNATNVNPIPINIDFGEIVVGFDVTDIAVSNGTAQSFVDVDGQNFTMEVVPTADGTVTIDIAGSVAQDLAGNESLIATQFSIDYDGTGPLVTFDQDGTTTNDTNLSGTISDPSDVIQISVDGGTTLTGATNNGDGTWSYDLSSDPNFIGSAVYSIYLDAQDTLGNQTILSTGTVTIDQAGPVITFDQDGQTVNDTNLSGTISGPSDILQVSVDGGTTLTGATNNGDGTWSYDLSGDPNFGGDGAYSIYLDAVDILVNQTLLTTGSVTIDQTAPVITVDETGTSIRNPQITGAIDDPAATIEIEIEGETVPATNVGDGTWILTAGSLSAGLADGTYGVTATATDAAGNIGTDNTSDELIITQSVFALSASEINSTGFTARWSTGLDVQTYQVDISTTNDFSTFVAGFENFETTATGVFVTNLDFSTNYYYRVRLVNTNDVVSANSNTRRVKTTVDLPTLADSLALVQIYEAITPQGLDWETERLRNWDGVTLDLNRTRVDIVNISNTQAAGNMPNPFTGDAFANGGLSNMTGMDVSDNEITGLMDYSSTSVSTLFVNSNSLDFGDLEPIASLGIGTLDYSDQASIQFNETTDGSPIEVRYSNDYSLSMTIGGSNNTFSWFRNDSQISTGTGFVIDGSEGVIVAINYDNMGEFRAEVTSSLVPGLTIAVDPQTIWAVADMQVSVTDADGNSLTAPLDASMMETTRTATGFRVLEKLEGVNSSTFTFPDVVLGNYIIFVESDIDKYIPTYYGDVFEWTKADTLFFRSDDVIEMSMVPVPGETTGPGTLDVLIEEDFGDDGGRIEARRRAAKRKCGLRRKTGGGRVDQDDDEFELIAYGETDDNGEFQFGFLPEGTYRFFVEYPGIPLDESSFVQFEVGEEGVSDTDFKLAAFATEDGIEVTIETVLGVILEYFKDLQIYPNPSSQYLNVKYRHLKSGDVTAQLVDLAGNTKWSQDLRNGFDGEIKIDVSDYEEGIYILRFYDRESRNENVVSFRVIVRD